MNQFISNCRPVLMLPSLLLSFLLFSSCAGASPAMNDADTVKCVDMKPAPTTYANNLNAIDHAITIDKGVTMVNNFGVIRESMLATDFTGRDMLPISETFNLEAIDEIICQPNAIGFRVYMAMDDNQKVRFVLVGVDGDGKDIIQRKNENPAMSKQEADDAGNSTKVFETGQRWP